VSCAAREAGTVADEKAESVTESVHDLSTEKAPPFPDLFADSAQKNLANPRADTAYLNWA
jgi:hypothetical protein